MEYKFSPTAGYYGIGGWVCYTVDALHGFKNVWKVFATEDEAKKYCGK